MKPLLALFLRMMMTFNVWNDDLWFTLIPHLNRVYDRKYMTSTLCTAGVYIVAN